MISTFLIVVVLVSFGHCRVKMGVISDQCDNGQKYLEVDFDTKNTSLYRCKGDHIPLLDPDHICLPEPIHYNVSLPTSGSHRPLWPVYGTYVYCPPQRWLHSLEHGAVVFLYHPCAQAKLVDIISKLVRSCLYRHIITPNPNADLKRPFVLLSWRNRIEMNTPTKVEIINFIKNHAIRGREKTGANGQYFEGLLHSAHHLKDSPNDEKLCPDDI